MEFVGFVRAPGLDEQRWIQMIDEHPSLARPVAEKRINPFTRQLADFPPNPSFARVIVEGDDVGSMQWSLDGSTEILVLGRAELVTAVACNVAALLGGTFDASPIDTH